MSISLARRGAIAKRMTTTAPGEFYPNAINNPSAAGYPDATNTGVSDEAALRRVPEDVTSGPGWSYRADLNAIQTNARNADISNIRLEEGMIIISHASAVIRNVYLSSYSLYPIDTDYNGETRDASSALGLLIEDTRLEGLGNGSCLVGISYNTYTARRVHITGCQDGFKADSDVLIEDCFVEDLAYIPESYPGAGDDSHLDGVQTTGGSNVTVRHSTFRLSQPGTSSIFQFGTEWGTPNTNWTIENNLLDGGGWTFNSNSPVDGTIVRNNRITRNYGFGINGYLGTNVTWTGNIFDDNGATIPE